MTNENLLCLKCLSDLPRTNLHRLPNNFIWRRFKGRIPINDASSFLLFTKGSSTQTLIHQLKYNGRQDIGERLGELYGYDLMSEGYAGPEVIIPLPLHKAKEKKRGFNQCDSIVRGLNKYFNADAQLKNVVRNSNNASQTRKGRWDRWINVNKIFEVKEPKNLRGRHVLLVDDVITTGSTLEACGRAVLDAGASKLSVLTLATA